jgi:hypothetical protein
MTVLMQGSLDSWDGSLTASVGALEPSTYLWYLLREQDKIGWDNLLKGRIGKQWIEYVKKHLEHENIKLQAT